MNVENSVDSLNVSGLCFSYGKVPALDHVDLVVPGGRFVALLGANGAGKTTFFSLITGLYSAKEGDISIVGNDLRSDTLKALASMGVVFQKTTLDMDLTVLQNLRYSAALQGITLSETKVRVTAAMQQHGLTDLSKRKVAALSGGQKRRVELARALLHQPALILLDEPTVGLDLQSRTDFVAHVKGLCESHGVGVLWATHLMDEVADQDLVYVLHKGRVIAKGDASELMQQHNVTSMKDLFNHLVEAST